MSERIMRWLWLGAPVLSTGIGCAARPALKANLEPMAFTAEPTPPPTTPPILTENHFRRDRVGSLSEADLRRVLDAPVFLETEARIARGPGRRHLHARHGGAAAGG